MEWITCENTYEESWRRLLEFANNELAFELIESRFGAATNKTKKNYLKQAEQARVSLLQAKEYFEAARNSSLFTQPNHVYYGAVALSTACMLLRGSGDYSLDSLRKNTKNAHHGLTFSTGANSKSASQGVHLLENSFIRIAANGHFSNWYRTLNKKQAVCSLLVTKKGNATNTVFRENGEFVIPEFGEIEGESISLVGLIKRIPDIHRDLSRYGILVPAARGEHKITYDKAESSVHHKFTFHASPSEDTLKEVLEQFNSDGKVYFCFDHYVNTTSAIVTTNKIEPSAMFNYPNSRETLDHRIIYFAEDTNTPEIVDLFGISYALSMLSRYYPDLWISFLESHCKGSKLVESVIQTLILKIPNLMLNEISDQNYVISNHRPFWF
jgi:hypothetical protein